MSAATQPLRVDALLRFRPVIPEDVLSLRESCWPERSPQTVAEFIWRCTVQMKNERALAVVGEAEGQIVAFALLTCWRDVGEIGDLIVTPLWRSQGVGSALIAHLTDIAQARGVARIEIGAAASNPRALALYQRLGFHPRHTVEIDLGNGHEPVIYLSKSLT